MAYVRRSSECDHETCQGSGKQETCVGLFVGGWLCSCPCHNDDGYRKKMIDEKREAIDTAIRAALSNTTPAKKEA